MIPIPQCRACQVSLDGKPDQCVTDCGHIFCLSCVCRQLGHEKNRCSVCQSVVKLVRQIDPNGDDAKREKPCTVKFSNTTFVLYVSIWSVDDPTATLAKLFHLESNARLIHQGKIIKKGDVWPGAVVQLIGTRKSLSASKSVSFTGVFEAFWSWLKWFLYCLLTPFRFIYLFFHSMIMGQEYSNSSHRYAPIEQTERVVAPTFQTPGRVAPPTETEHV
ncbi:hypothetical protein THRCLA_05141 [Thraustotheca clavata]|uniref:RING-type domain-containing protein n=1 Tax=Thraustotheca clavata TaxID=74557 RepID=A0A1V9ZWV8_9STRA|nr:hypothetical protein THRCLA_05141 [Thraustotheca clavata]